MPSTSAHNVSFFFFLLQTFRSSEPFLFVPLACSVVLPVGTRTHWQDEQNMTKGNHLPPAFTCTEEGYIWLVDWLVGVLLGWFKGMTLGLTCARG